MTSIQKTETFLKEQFEGCAYYKEHPDEKAYRIQHSYRAAHNAREIARAEGLDEEGLIIGALLHDVGYCFMPFENGWQEHGRLSAKLARPFLEGLGLGEERVREICYGIAIHADGKADFPGERTPFALSISDADDADRFDAYRIYETMEYYRFSVLDLEEKRKWLGERLDWIRRRLEVKAGTETGGRMIAERLLYQRAYYERVLGQLERSEGIAL